MNDEELRERLVKAAHSLEELAGLSGGARAAHLHSKAEGVRLAISYMDERYRAAREDREDRLNG